MSVSLRLGPIAYPVGRVDVLGSFFDTVTIWLEGGARSSRVPTLAGLYRDGELSPDAAELAREEMANVDYFVTADGRQLIAVMDSALDASARTGKPMRIA